MLIFWLYLGLKCCNSTKNSCCYTNRGFWLYLGLKCCNSTKKSAVTPYVENAQMSVRKGYILGKNCVTAKKAVTANLRCCYSLYVTVDYKGCYRSNV